MNITKETIKEISKKWNLNTGGLADNSNPSDFDIDQLIKGVKIELEHTKDLKIALKISMDHLQEFPKYYDYLIDMENKIKKELKENVTMRSIREYLEECTKGDAMKPGKMKSKEEKKNRVKNIFKKIKDKEKGVNNGFSY